jgi:pimeloyl-ACP methyl ester carboxylesterase
MTRDAADVETHDTTPTRYIDVGDDTYAYRRFGIGGSTPIVFFQCFMGNLDLYDPAITDALARGRDVILTDNKGVGLSTGDAPDTLAGLAQDMIDFIEALGLDEVDLLGFSMGGEVAQQIALVRPDLVRRLVLVGTGPRGGEGMTSLAPDVQPMFTTSYEPQDLMWLPVFFSRSTISQEAGRRFLERVRARKDDRDVAVRPETVAAHGAAQAEWGRPYRGSYEYLRSIATPTLIVNGSNDIILPTVNSFLMQQTMPNAELLLFPDSNHGSHLQYTEPFLAKVKHFLTS